MTITSKTLFAAALAAAAIVAGSPVGAAPGTQLVCKGTVYVGVDKDADKTSAAHGAIMNWQKNVKAALGDPWAIWQNATGKSVTCKYEDPTPHPGDETYWKCQAKARACIRKPIFLGPQPKSEFVPPPIFVPRRPGRRPGGFVGTRMPGGSVIPRRRR
jgi:hypothetical protein